MAKIVEINFFKFTFIFYFLPAFIVLSISLRCFWNDWISKTEKNNNDFWTLKTSEVKTVSKLITCANELGKNAFL